MPPAPLPPAVFEFAGFALDEERGELRRGGETVAIRPTPLRLLGHLLRHPDRVIPKSELFEAVWPDVAVGEASLATALKELRRALGGEDGQAHRVETLRGRGVRFREPVELRRARGAALRPLVGREAERERLDRALAAHPGQPEWTVVRISRRWSPLSP